MRSSSCTFPTITIYFDDFYCFICILCLTVVLRSSLNVTRLYLTPEVENKFRLINESEQSLRSVIERYPGKEYQGILIGPKVKATRSNVLNPNNIGSYGAGRSYFPYRPLTKKEDIQEATGAIDKRIDKLCPVNEHKAFQISIDQAVELISATKSIPSGGGLWDTTRGNALLRSRVFGIGFPLCI